MGKYTELEKYFDTYSREDIKKAYWSYIDDDYYEDNKLVLLFVFLTTKIKNMPRDFVDKYLHLVTDYAKNEDELLCKKAMTYSRVISNLDLDDKYLEPYLDVINWDEFSARKDLTLEYFEKYKDKINISRIRADLGRRFLTANLEKMDKYTLEKMNLSKKLMIQTNEIHKIRLFRFHKLKDFSFEFALSHMEKFNGEEWLSLIKKYRPDFEKTMTFIEKLEEHLEEDPEWNEIIGELLSAEGLSVEQKKDIKWYCHLL